ncbi:MAG: class I tRNA ligase family protein, partial [Finegoldia magna]|nr:class I tRNA ligase family protein [Finegoldia magna]
SYGAEIKFPLKEVDEKITVFTTRADTIFGATYMVISVDHPLIEKYSDQIKNIEEIRSYRQEVAKKSELERTDLSKEKTGYKIDGLTAINPLTNKDIPVYVSDYVLMTYGTGAIMAVPAHDDRDYEFAKKFNIDMIPVIEGSDIENCAFTETNEGNLINSGFLNGLTVDEAKEKMYEYIEEKEIGHKKTNYKLRDWVFSRQRYWGEPIPLVYCEHCGWVPLDEKDLPLVLPKVDNYEPTDNGESPLSKIDDFVHTKCPKCGRDAVRETDTMPQWAGSSWYYLRYTDPHNDEAIASKENLDYYTPVDWYNGGMEHTTLHLLYSRFWHKFLYDIGVVPTKEPYMKRTSHGMILGDNNEKMSKSRGNVVNPDDIVRDFGADTLRCYEMFIGDFEKSAPWSENGVKGCRKFLDKVWRIQ